MIDVDHERAQRRAGIVRLAEQALEFLIERASVQTIRQRIACRQDLEPAVLLLDLVLRAAQFLQGHLQLVVLALEHRDIVERRQRALAPALVVVDRCGIDHQRQLFVRWRFQ